MLSSKTADSWLKKGKKSGRTEIHPLEDYLSLSDKEYYILRSILSSYKKSPDKTLVLNNLLGYPVSFAQSRFSVSKAKSAITFK